MGSKSIKNIVGLYTVVFTLCGFAVSFLLLIITARLSSSIALLLFFLPEFNFDLSFEIGLISLLVFNYLLGQNLYKNLIITGRKKYFIAYLYSLLSLLLASLVYNTIRLILYDNIIECDIDSIYIFFCRPLFIGLIFGIPSVIIFGTLFTFLVSRLKIKK